MRKIGFLLILGLVSVSASAITVETPGKGTLTSCKDSFGGFLSSCDKEKVQIPQLIWLWFAFKRGVGTFQYIEKAFKTLGSNMSGQIYGQAYEYLSVLRSTNKILNRITQEFEIDPMTNWRALEHLRHFDPKAIRVDF